MLITDSFVMLNYPKSGSTFARTLIKDIYQKRLEKYHPGEADLFIKELVLPDISLTGVPVKPNQHGTYRQIPKEFRDREVVSVIRDPYSRFLSRYLFGWWAKNPIISPQLLTRHFPGFPELSLDEFVKLNELSKLEGRFKGRSIEAHVGNQTVQFIQMFFKDPDRVLENISDEYLDSDDIFHDLAPIRFLRQEYLNEDLANFLQDKGFSEEEVELVRSRERINVTDSDVKDKVDLWTPDSIDYIRYFDRMIFRIMDKYDIAYSAPDVAIN